MTELTIEMVHSAIKKHLANPVISEWDDSCVYISKDSDGNNIHCVVGYIPDSDAVEKAYEMIDKENSKNNFQTERPVKFLERFGYSVPDSMSGLILELQLTHDEFNYEGNSPQDLLDEYNSVLIRKGFREVDDWEEVKVVNSSDNNVKKLVFTTEGDTGAVAESVLYKYPTYKERTVICCSTQSGCPVGCRFCGTGEFFIRNLTSSEIISQVIECIRIVNTEEGIEGRDIEKFQIMFMSMGEPMLNWKELKPALYELNRLYPNAKLLISTMAPNATSSVWEDMVQTSIDISAVGLQFSVHEAVQEERDKLIPMSAKLSLKEISDMGEKWHKATGRKPYFNYCVHGKNNTKSHVDELYGYFNPRVWESTVSVICEADEGVAAANERQRKLAEDFMQLMLLAGYSTRMFDPAGQDDIGGGCGQLWYVQDWASNHSDLTNKSHGSGIDRIHAPK